MNNKTICIVGLGYIGLPTAALLAENGYNVIGVDINEHIVQTINQGNIHIVEPDLDSFVESAVRAKKLKAYSTPQSGDIYIICVPTPFHEDGDIPKPNIDYVLNAVNSITPYIKNGDLVILESTSPVGTTQKIGEVLGKAGIDLSKVHVAYCPERVLPGKIMEELIYNNRIVGGLTPQATKEVTSFYKTFVKGEVLETDASTAEMCKLTENSYRDVNIAFANELSIICENAGINVWNLIDLANHHPRVNILQPGVGVGGHCIAVDPWFIVSKDPENARLIRTSREVNNDKTDWVINQVKICADKISSKLGRASQIVCFGLAFKPDIDDLRESPALRVATDLQEQGYKVMAVEPNIQDHDQIKLLNLEDGIKKADLVVLLVKHKQFCKPSFKQNFQDIKVLDFCGGMD
jgi:UDP-N-acetyl-D-mannosaminuronic acid dehydrogenase